MEKSASERPGKKRRASPHAYLILLGLCVLMIGLTHLLPAGEYDRQLNEAGQTVVIPGTYHEVEPAPVSFLSLPVKLQEGMIAGGEIMIFMLVVGGALGIINEAGAINFFIGSVLSRKLRGRETLFIPVLLFAMALGGMTFGMTLEAAAFIPPVIALSIALGYDNILAVAIIFLGSNIGYTAGIYNPYNVGVAQSLAELPTYSGAWYRWIFLAVLLTITSAMLMSYANRIKADPSRSVVYDLPESRKGWVRTEEETGKPGPRQYLGLAIFAGGFVCIIYGSICAGWWIPQIAGAFFWMALLTGILFRFPPNRMCDLFAGGARDVVAGALSVGLARAIATILTDGRVMDTIVNALAYPLALLPKGIQAAGMMVAQTIINLGIPAGSAQATATMPIIIPLSDLLGLSRQVAVFAFQCGDGITNGLIPTYTTLITLLAIGKVPYDRWLRLVTKIVLLQWLAGLVMCVVAAAINYS